MIDFWELLPLVAHQKWTLRDNEFIRNEKDQCPICALVTEIDPSIRFKDDFRMALGRLELYEEYEWLSIVSGADGYNLEEQRRLLSILEID